MIRKIGDILEKRIFSISIFYVFAMIMMGTFIFLMTSPDVMAVNDPGATQDNNGTFTNILYSLITVASFLFLLSVVWVMSKKLRKNEHSD